MNIRQPDIPSDQPCGIVTRIPPRVLGYSHVGQMMPFDKVRKLQTDEGLWNKSSRLRDFEAHEAASG